MTIKNSEHYLRKACELAERAERQGTEAARPEVMAALTELARLNTELYGILLQREVAGLEPIEQESPVAVLDCHDRRWERGGDGLYRTKALGIAGVVYRPENLAGAFGPLRPAEVSR